MRSLDLKRNLRLLYLFQFLKSLQLFGAVSVPFYLEWGGLDYTRMFVLEGAFSLFMFVLEVPTGAIADRFGRKWSLVAGALASGASFMMFGLVRSYPLFFVANFLCAVGATCISGADRALLYDSLLAAGHGEQGRSVLSRYEAVGSVGMLIGFPLGSVVAGMPGLHRPASLALVFFLSGVVFALAALPMLLAREAPRGKVEKPSLFRDMAEIRLLLAPGQLRRLTCNYALISATTFFMFWFYQSLAGEAGLPIAWNGALAAGLNALGMVLLWRAAQLEASLGLARLLFITAIAPGLLYLGLAWYRPPVLALPAAFLIVGMRLLRAPLLSDLINKQVESRNRATVLSGISMIERAVTFVFYPLVGLAADRSLSLAFAGLGVCSLLALLLPLRLGQAEQKQVAAVEYD